MKRYLLLFLSIFLLASCSGATKKVEKKPSWITDRGKMGKSDQIEVVGVSQNMGKASWDLAEQNARVTISKYVEVYMDHLTTTLKRVTSRSSHLTIVQKTKETSKASLRGLDVKKRWHDKKNDKYYVLVVMNFSKFQKSVEKKVEKVMEEDKIDNSIEAVKKRSAEAKKRMKDKLKNMSWN